MKKAPNMEEKATEQKEVAQQEKSQNLQSPQAAQTDVKSSKKTEFWRAVKFTLFSLSAGAIQLGLFAVLYEWIHWYYWPSYLIALIASVVWNFTFNRKFTFKSANNVPLAMTLVLCYYAVFTPLSTWWGNALEGIGWNGTLVTVINMLINFVTEFLYQRFVVFRNSLDTQPVKTKNADKETTNASDDDQEN